MAERSAQRWGIALGDVTSITAVLLYGRVVSHGQPLASFGTVETVLPFLIGWGIGAILLGAYAEDPFVPRGRSLRIVTATWLIAVAIGLIARSSPSIHGSITWPFGLVITLFVLVVLLLWRTATKVLADRSIAVEAR